ncbi:MAG: hypothetical protein P9L88_01330 [Candidatus Tantalella remota]|nr:hypothetical protein [Candidatus Tantalella remota]
MTKNTRKKSSLTILAIGDIADFDSFCKLDKEKRYINKCGIEYKAIDYDHILKKGELDILTKNTVIFPFFPFKYWDKNIEHKKYRGLYGNISFSKKFLTFCKLVDRNIDMMFAGKKYIFMNDLQKCALYRDKKTVMTLLKKKGVKVPATFYTKSAKRIKDLLFRGKKIFIKPRCGSMGKGITYLEEGSWKTNFKVRKNKISNRHSDYGWKFRNVTGNSSFLRDLLRRDLQIEEAVDTLVIGDHKVDFRVYVFSGKALYVYPRLNSRDSVTTNISQGGKGRPGILKKIPKKVVAMIEKESVKAAKALGLGLAGVDVVVDQDMKNAYIVDINMFPGLPKRRTINLARVMVDEIASKRTKY